MACIEDLREKREELNRSLLRDEEEKSKIQKELSTLTERLSRLNEDLARKMQVRGRGAGRAGCGRAGCAQGQQQRQVRGYLLCFTHTAHTLPTPLMPLFLSAGARGV